MSDGSTSRDSRRGTRSRARSSQSGGRLDAAQQRAGRGDVRERAQHPGDVAQRAALAPPLGQRAGRLALEVEQHPAVVGCAASARDGSRRGGGSRARRRRGSSAGAAARAPPRRARGAARAPASSSGRSRKIASISSSTVAVSSPSDSVDGCSGAKLGSVESRAEQRCAAHPSPRRGARARRGTTRRRRADRVECELPAVIGRRGRTAGGCPSVASIGRADVRVPAGELRDVLEAVLGEEAQQLELGVDARPRAGGRP